MKFNLIDFKNRISSTINPGLFLVSMLVSFLSLAFLGKLCSGNNLFTHFVRFHPGISADRQFYPTYSELYQLAKSRIEKDKVLVIVSGDSIFFGLGQDSAHVWSEKLAKILGDNFTVVNLAFRGGRVFEGGYWVFERLRDEGHDVVLLTNTWADRYVDREPISPYKYLYWDARYKQMLSNFNGRDQVIKSMSPDSGNQTYLARRAETTFLYGLDRYLYFRDLWNTFTYSCFNTTWSDSLGAKFFYPRMYHIDEIADEFQPGRVRKSDRFWKDLIDKEYIVLRKDKWDMLKDRLEKTVRPDVRGRILIGFVEPNRKFVQNPELLEQTKGHATEIYRDLGFNPVTIDGISTEGYVDGVHLNNTGGGQLAEAITAPLKSLVERRDLIDGNR